MEKDRITRYVRVQDVPRLADDILGPILGKTAQEMAETTTGTVAEWKDDLYKALVRGELLIVVDDVQRRVGLVRTDEPPFSGLVAAPAGPTADSEPQPVINALDIRSMVKNKDENS